jgi:hypothetical protein
MVARTRFPELDWDCFDAMDVQQSKYPIVNDALRLARTAQTAKSSDTRSRARKKLRATLEIMLAAALADYTRLSNNQ